MNRPSWEEYFLNIAEVVATRSHDAQTKHGCVIVKDNRILGTGYNGFPRGMKDDSLPNTRPDKYIWMDHSEINALANCTMRPEGATAYVGTGEPCNNCLISMWRHGIVKVVYRKGHGSFDRSVYDPEQRKIFLEQTGMELVEMNFAYIPGIKSRQQMEEKNPNWTWRTIFAFLVFFGGVAGLIWYGISIKEPEPTKPVLYHFTASWCLPCKEMSNLFKNDREVKQAIDKNFRLIELDIENAPKLAFYCFIVKVPAYRVVDDEGRILLMGDGKMSKQDFLKWIKLYTGEKD